MPLRNVTPAARRPSGLPTEESTRQAQHEMFKTMDRMISGKLNCTAEVTLSNDGVATTLTFTDQKIAAGSVVLWSPKTANAYAKPIKYAVCSEGQVVFTHDAGTETDRTFGIAVFG